MPRLKAWRDQSRPRPFRPDLRAKLASQLHASRTPVRHGTAVAGEDDASSDPGRPALSQSSPRLPCKTRGSKAQRATCHGAAMPCAAALLGVPGFAPSIKAAAVAEETNGLRCSRVAAPASGRVVRYGLIEGQSTRSKPESPGSCLFAASCE